MIDERVDLGLEVAGLSSKMRLMPALDLALRLRVAGRAAHVTHIAFVQPFGEVGLDVGRAIV